MKSQFLVQKTCNNSKHVFNCTMLNDYVIDDSEEECYNILRNKLADFLATQGRKWVDDFKGVELLDTDRLVNCPNAFILLPLDAWHCKYDKKPCSLAIDINNESNFLEQCRSEKKSGIFQSVKDKQYDGFHHVSGRYLCPVCDENLGENRQNFKYHYPWELYPLWEVIDFETEEAFWVLKKSGLSRAIKNSKVCAKCFVNTVEKFFSSKGPGLGFFVVEIDFFPR